MRAGDKSEQSQAAKKMACIPGSLPRHRSVIWTCAAGYTIHQWKQMILNGTYGDGILIIMGQPFSLNMNTI